MSKKYIIKNCPAFCNNFCGDDRKEYFCEEITDCLLKWIVEKCKKTCRMRCTNDCLGTKKHCGYGQILELFEIEECE